MKYLRTYFSVVLVLFTTSTFAKGGDEILKKVDSTVNAAKDKTVNMSMDLIDSSNNKEHREILMYQKGDKKLIKFIKPSSVKGVGFLSLTDTQMYLYMPAFRRIRRIASHVKNDTFMGTDFSYDDMGNTNYSDDYKVTASTIKGNIAHLVLKPKNNDKAYSKLEMLVDLKTYIPSEVKFYNKSNKLWKVLKASDVKKIKGYYTIMTLEMKDIIKNHTTIMKLSNIKYDTGLNDKIFNKRFLKR